MTNQDIFIQIVSEVSGRPKEEIADLLAAIRRAHPGGKWDKELSDKEAETLLVELRAEAPGILRWLVEGAMQVARHERDITH